MFIAPIFAAIGSGLAALGITAQTLLTIAFNVGMALIQMLMTRPPKPDDMQQVVRQSVPIRVKHLGRVRTGGPLLFIEVKDRILYTVQYFGEGPVDKFEEFFLDNRAVNLDRDGWVATPPYDYKNGDIVRIFLRTGQPTSRAYTILRSVFAGIVNSRWRGDGLVTACIRARSVNADKVAKFYPSGIPMLNVVARFGSCFNPASDARVWTESLPLHLLEYLTSEDGLGIPMERIDTGSFTRAHRTASEILPTKDGGSVRRYYGSTTWRMDEQPKDVINRLLLSMDGRLFLTTDGKIGLQAGEWIEPTVHIPDEVIIDCELRDSSTPIQEANEIVVKYTNPSANWSPATMDPWRDEAGLRRTGGRLRNTTVELYGIQSHNHARRVAKLLDQRLNPRWQGTIRTTLWGMKAWDQRFITVSQSDLGIANQSFEVLEIGLDEQEMTVFMRIASVERTLYDFDPQKEEGTAPVAPESLDQDAIPTPENFRAVVEQEWVTEVINKKPERIKRLRLTLTVAVPKRNKSDKGIEDEGEDPGFDNGGPLDNDSAPSKVSASSSDDDDDDVMYEFQVAKANSGRWRSLGGLIEEPRAETTDIVDGQRYDARVRFRAQNGLPGDWVTIEDILAIGDKDPPRAPTAVRARITGPREVTVTCTTQKDDNFAAVELWRDKDKTARGAKRIATVYGDAGSVVTLVDDNAPEGSHFYFVRAINFSAVASNYRPARNNPLKIKN